MKKEDLWKVLDSISEWIRFADAKAGATLAAQGLLASLLIPSLIGNKRIIFASPVLLILVGVCFAFAIASFLLCMRCITPRTKVKKSESVIFFSDIASSYPSPQTYRNALERLDKNESAVGEQLANQVWENSTIAVNKFQNSTWALRCFLFELLGIITISLLWFLKY